MNGHGDASKIVIAACMIIAPAAIELLSSNPNWSGYGYFVVGALAALLNVHVFGKKSSSAGSQKP